MSDRPADTIPRLADYLWWLLPEFLKPREQANSLVGQLVGIAGDELDAARSTVGDVTPQLLPATASGPYLDKLARSRTITRRSGESDESLRTRVLAAFLVRQQGGTIPGMVNGLAAVGYAVLVEEPYRGTPTWSRFIVRVVGWDGVVADQTVFYETVRALKPAHTRALIECELEPATWDDWPLGGDPLPLDDGGSLDSWLSG